MNIDFGKAFSFSIERLKTNPLFYIVGGLIVFGINFFVSLIGNIFTFIFTFFVELLIKIFRLHGEGARIITSLVTGLGSMMIGMILGFVIAPVFVGFLKGIKKEYEGKEAEIGDIFSALNMALPAMLNYAVATVIAFLGILF